MLNRTHLTPLCLLCALCASAQKGSFTSPDGKLAEIVEFKKKYPFRLMSSRCVPRSTIFPSRTTRITSASTSTARKTTPVSVEKYGCPVPPAKKTTIFLAKYLLALSFE